MHNKNTDKEKATACQKAPDKTQMDKMIQRSKDYGLKVAAPNMKTDTQTDRSTKAQWESLATEALEDSGYWKREARTAQAQADKLAEELRKLIEITPYSGTISARETLDAYDNER